MHDLLIGSLLLGMIVLPCLIAMRVSAKEMA